MRLTVFLGLCVLFGMLRLVANQVRFRSTSLNNAHAKGGPLCFKAVFIVAASVISQGAWARDSISLLQREKLQLAALYAVKNSNSMPNESPLISIKDNSTWIVLSGQKRLITPLIVRYKDMNNMYCLVASTNVELTSLKFLPLPPQAFHDSCSGLYPYYLLVQNKDDGEMIVHGVSVKSNRDGGSVTEVIFYLRDPKSELGFCYSADASAQLAPSDLRSSAILRLALDKSKRRLGLKNFSCSV
jgi:hypothetical protein